MKSALPPRSKPCRREVGLDRFVSDGARSRSILPLQCRCVDRTMCDGECRAACLAGAAGGPSDRLMSLVRSGHHARDQVHDHRRQHIDPSNPRPKEIP